MFRSHHFLRAALPAFIATCVFAAPDDDDLFSSKPGAKPQTAVAAKPAAQIGLPAVVTATLVATGEGGIQTWQMEGIKDWLKELTYLESKYAIGTSQGGVMFSADGRRWETSQLASKRPVSQILHDGQRWVALTTREKPFLHYSSDGKTWTANPAWSLYDQQIAVRNGLLWSAGQLLGGFTSFSMGEIDSPTARSIANHDGQFSRTSRPNVALQSGGQLFLVMPFGELFGSDNGEYWQLLGPPAGLVRVNEALLAEGNDRTVLFLMNVDGKTHQLVVRTQVGGQATWETAADVPFSHASGLAYGGGRFVAIGFTAVSKYQEPELYESNDGLTWKRVAALDKDIGNVAFGPAGFMAGGSLGKFFVYNPKPLPEKPAFVRSATPVPPITIKSFGRNFSGKGKYRKETGPETPDQIRVQELENLYPKARRGDAAAKREIAMASIDGKYVESNPWVAETWLKEAIAAGDPIAPRGYAMLLSKWKTNTKKETLAALYRQSAERGDGPAMVAMVEHFTGSDVVSDAERKKWAPLAAEKDAKFALRDKNRADYAANIAKADAGDAQACYRVAQLLVEGNGVMADTTKAETYLRKAIAQKHPESMLLLANLFEIKAGQRAFASDAIAAEFRELITGAADAGNQDAQIRLAGYLAEGQRSFEKDLPRAYATHLKLAQSGYVPSMAIVGRALYTGTLATKDEAAGLVWIRKAAEANDRNAKLMLTEIEKLNARDAERPPLDAKVDGVTPEVLAALKAIQIAPNATIDESSLRLLINAVWYDAGYSNLDEDLAQELAGAVRPVVVTSVDGQSVSFTKPLPPETVANFAQIFPVKFQPTNIEFYFVLWQRTANAGLLVGGTRVSAQAKSAIRGALAKGLYQITLKERTASTAELTRYFTQLKTSHDAASPAVQKDFRDLIRGAVDTAKRAAGEPSAARLNDFVNQPWLKEPVIPAK